MRPHKMNKGRNYKDRPRYREPHWADGSQPNPLTGRYYDTADMMEVLHVSDRTLLRWRKEGRIPYKKLGGKIYYLADAVDRIMRENDNGEL